MSEDHGHRPASQPAAPAARSTEPVIRATHLHKRFRRHVAVEDLSFTLSAGEVVGLLGPNGAGKTTTMKMLVGLTRPTSGSATIEGRPAAEPAARRRLGYLPEQFRFPDWMTGMDVLVYHARLAGLALPPADLRAALERVGLGGRGDDRISGYSKGMQQRLGVAQALLGEPRAVLLDEPTSALDPLGRRQIRDIIRDLARAGVGVLLNSHLLSEVELVCDRAVIVDQGQVIRSGSLEDLAVTTVEARVELDRIDQGALDLAARHGTVAVHDGHSMLVAVDSGEEVADLADDLVSAGYRLRALVPVRRSLEDVFVGLVRDTGR